jgi:ABC-type proline/glycine betaine transport system permease subunit
MYKAIAATTIFQTLWNVFGVKAQQLLFHILSPKAWRTILSGGVHASYLASLHG